MEDISRGSRPQFDDEISLVDLAATFLKRRRVFYAVFFLVTLAGVAYAFIALEKYQYVTLIKLSEKSDGSYIEAPASVIAELGSIWEPDLQAAHYTEQGWNLPFAITATNPENTGLIRVVSEAPASAEDLVEKSHRELFERLRLSQEQAIAGQRRSLERQIESLNSTIDMLKGGEDTGDALASSIAKQFYLETVLESLALPEILVVSRQSSSSAGPARSLIVVLAIMLGLMGGVFLAFFAEFIGLVRDKIAEA